MQMSASESQSLLKFSPFHGVLDDGLARMIDSIQSDDFTFGVQGKPIESTLVEAGLLSPKVYELIRSDSSIRPFDISSDDINASSFEYFLKLFHSHECPTFHADKDLSFLSLCCVLGNKRLALAFFASLHSTSSLTLISYGSADAGFIGFHDANVDSIA
jgi:hypothetical protein